MSHRLIVELSEEPVAEEDRMTAYDLTEDKDIQYAADYVDDLEDVDITYEEAIDLFLQELGVAATYNKEDNSITFVHVKNYFEEDFKIVKEMMEKATLQEFMDSLWIYNVRCYLRPIFGTYIKHTWDGSYPLPEFIRDYAKDGTKFYIGGICDYHC